MPTSDELEGGAELFVKALGELMQDWVGSGYQRPLRLLAEMPASIGHPEEARTLAEASERAYGRWLLSRLQSRLGLPESHGDLAAGPPREEAFPAPRSAR